MTDLDVIYTQKAVGILSVMKNIATEYIKNVYNSTSHSTLSISWKHVESIICNNYHVCWAYKKEHTGEEYHNCSKSN
jgi:TATA-binding protein-associated factor Taf7